MEEKMKSRNKYISLAIIIVLALSLAACERSASPSPQEPLATPQDPGMELVEMMASEGEDSPEAGEGSDQETDDGQPGTLPPADEQQPAEGEQPAGEGDLAPTDESAAPPVVEPQPLVDTVRPETYTLQKGEFPYCIARRFDVSPQELLSLNGLSVAQSRALQPGLMLRIPQTGNPFPGTRALQPHPTTYTVQSSTETIYSIACKFGSVEPVNIANQNGLVPPYTLTFGQTLNIP
jgi:LysM repeat protein